MTKRSNSAKEFLSELDEVIRHSGNFALRMKVEDLVFNPTQCVCHVSVCDNFNNECPCHTCTESLRDIENVHLRWTNKLSWFENNWEDRCELCRGIECICERDDDELWDPDNFCLIRDTNVDPEDWRPAFRNVNTRLFMSFKSI